MAKQLDPVIGEVLKEHGFGPEACWDCHGTWVIFHSVLEKIAAASGVMFDSPQIVEADSANKTAAMVVSGSMGGRVEWATGEASPANCKNAYPWAMAEKRAKDRVVLKLIGLAGLAYSEEEAEDFKESAPPKPVKDTVEGEAWGGPLGKQAFKNALRDFNADLLACEDMDSLTSLLNVKQTIDLLNQCQRDAPDWWYGKEGSDVQGFNDRIEEKKTELQQKEAA